MGRARRKSGWPGESRKLKNSGEALQARALLMVSREMSENTGSGASPTPHIPPYDGAPDPNSYPTLKSPM